MIDDCAQEAVAARAGEAAARAEAAQLRAEVARLQGKVRVERATALWREAATRQQAERKV